MAPPFVPTDATVGVVPREGTMVTGDAPGGGLDSSHVNGDTTHSSRRREAISGGGKGGGPYGDAETLGGGAATTLSASSSNLLCFMENLPGMPTEHSLSC